MKLCSVLKTSGGLLLALTMLSACASPPKVQTTEAACRVLKPIDFHLCTDGQGESFRNECDTPETVMRIDQHNRELFALCQK